MATFELVCEICEEPFEAKSPRAKVCGSTCRSRKRRRPKAEPVEVDRAPEPDPRAGLVAAVTEEFEQAGVLHTVDAQLALQLARQMSEAGASGISGLSKEFRAVRAVALEAGKPAAAAEGPEPTEPEDEVEKARRRRDEARAAAAGRP